ncbi:hypothetical protein [Lysobacter hankyongensis]|uniref:Lipoprotein n=1 Tax=Lysobacter hankyongensis TaxID=1176535 RepID=A0ABP9BAJ6_9GAMM
MRIILLTALAVVVALPGCASRTPTADDLPPPPVAIGKSNRFEMTQNGRRMSASDFDAWMKARGIRIAKGPTERSSPKPVPKAQPKPRPKAQARAEPKPQPAATSAKRQKR